MQCVCLSLQVLWGVLQICLLSFPHLSRYSLIRLLLFLHLLSPSAFLTFTASLCFVFLSIISFPTVHTWLEGTKVKFSTTGTQHQSFSLSSHTPKQFECDIYNCRWTFPSNNLLAGFGNFHIIYLLSSKHTDDFSRIGSKSALYPNSPGPFFFLQPRKILLLIRIFNSVIFCLGFLNCLFHFSKCSSKDCLQTFPTFLVISQCPTSTSSSSETYFWAISSIKAKPHYPLLYFTLCIQTHNSVFSQPQ